MVDKNTVLNIAKLARLEISEGDLARYTEQLNSILGHVEALKRLDTAAIEATTHAVEVPNPLRPDRAVTNSIIDVVLETAPEHEARFFRVPKVI